MRCNCIKGGITLANKKKKNKNKKISYDNKKKIQEKKQLSREEINAKQDKLTNWFMLNIVYIIVGYIILHFIEKGYNSTETILYMNTICWSVFGVFLAIAAILFGLYFGVFKTKKRIKNYGILMSVLSLCGLYLALYNKIRLGVMAVIPSFGTVNSNFRIWSLMFALGIYAVISLVWYCIKLYRISHSE